MGAPSAAFCRIERWRGYVTSSFCARLPDGRMLESRTFRWRHAAPPPDGGSARAAYDELVGRLEAEGWTHHAEGPIWFATTFSRLPGATVHDRRRLRRRRSRGRGVARDAAPSPASPPES